MVPRKSKHTFTGKIMVAAMAVAMENGGGGAAAPFRNGHMKWNDFGPQIWNTHTYTSYFSVYYYTMSIIQVQLIMNKLRKFRPTERKKRKVDEKKNMLFGHGTASIQQLNIAN